VTVPMRPETRIRGCHASHAGRWALAAILIAMLGLGGCDDPKAKVASNVVTTSLWVLVSAGSAHTLAIKSDNTLWAWGDNSYGQLGLGAIASSPNTCSGAPCSVRPVQISAATNWAAVAAGLHHSLALDTAGNLYAWGDNSYGQLGNGSVSAPVVVPTFIPTGGIVWTQIAAGCYHSIGLESTNKVYAWGANDHGQGGVLPYVNPQLGAGSAGTFVMSGRNSVTVPITPTLAAGCLFSMAIDGANVLWTWGHNDYGQLGLGIGAVGNDQQAPVAIGGSTVSTIAAGESHSLAVATNGALYAWGDNTYGQLGSAPGASVPAPAMVGTLTTWARVYAGQYSGLATQTNGSILGWGRNEVYQLGDTTNIDRSAPVPVIQNIGTIFQLSEGGEFGAAVTTTGTLYLWGANGSGQLGFSTPGNGPQAAPKVLP